MQVSDLYRMGFNPVSGRHNFTTVQNPDYFKPQLEELHATEHGGFASDVEAEMAKLEWCDLMVWQFPLWWFGLPAILKGWVDRVFAMGRVYGMGHIYETGKFRGQRALLSLTTGGPEEAYQPGGFNGDIHAIVRPIQRGMLQFLGFDVLEPAIHFGPVRQDDAVRGAWLEGWSARLCQVDREQPIAVGGY